MIGSTLWEANPFGFGYLVIVPRITGSPRELSPHLSPMISSDVRSSPVFNNASEFEAPCKPELIAIAGQVKTWPNQAATPPPPECPMTISLEPAAVRSSWLSVQSM